MLSSTTGTKKKTPAKKQNGENAAAAATTKKKTDNKKKANAPSPADEAGDDRAAAASSPRDDAENVPDGGGEEAGNDGGSSPSDDEAKDGGVAAAAAAAAPPPVVTLSKSTRLKGYLTFVVASAINYNAALESDLGEFTDRIPPVGVVSADPKGQKYAQAASMVAGILGVAAIIMHFDRFTCLKNAWQVAFRPKSKIELSLLLFLSVWWCIATWIITSIRGVAGDGKGQYNLYFSTWVCCYTSFWTLERWCVAAGHPSLKTFMQSWPNRAPGWIAMFLLSLADLFCILDLYRNWEEGTDNAPFLRVMFDNVASGEWNWLIFLGTITFPLAAGFSFVELFRSTNAGQEDAPKSDFENVSEGVALLVLVCGWIPTVCIVTTPGGACSLIGNSYFFTWGTTVVVIETFVWWIRDWRKGIHEIIKQQEEEYKQAKLAVLKRSDLDRVREAKKRSGDGDDDSAAGVLSSCASVSLFVSESESPLMQEAPTD